MDRRFCLAGIACVCSLASAQQSTPADAERGTNQQAANTGATKTRSPASLIQPDPLDPLLRGVDREQAALNQNQHLVLKASYTFLAQYAVTAPGVRHTQFSGRLDFQGVWTFHQSAGRDPSKPDQTSLNMLLRSGTNIGQSQQWDLSDSLGSGLGTNSLQGGGAQRPIMINLLYVEADLGRTEDCALCGQAAP